MSSAVVLLYFYVKCWSTLLSLFLFESGNLIASASLKITSMVSVWLMVMWLTTLWWWYFWQWWWWWCVQGCDGEHQPPHQHLHCVRTRTEGMWQCSQADTGEILAHLAGWQAVFWWDLGEWCCWDLDGQVVWLGFWMDEGCWWDLGGWYCWDLDGQVVWLGFWMDEGCWWDLGGWYCWDLDGQVVWLGFWMDEGCWWDLGGWCCLCLDGWVDRLGFWMNEGCWWDLGGDVAWI